MADNEKEPLVERWLRSLKSRPTIAVILLVSVVIMGIGHFTDSIDNIVKFFVTYFAAPPRPNHGGAGFSLPTTPPQ
jgi:hypothetical protein